MDTNGYTISGNLAKVGREYHIYDADGNKVAQAGTKREAISIALELPALATKALAEEPVVGSAPEETAAETTTEKKPVKKTARKKA